MLVCIFWLALLSFRPYQLVTAAQYFQPPQIYNAPSPLNEFFPARHHYRVFNSVQNALKRWGRYTKAPQPNRSLKRVELCYPGSSLQPRGASAIPARLPANTVLYHARKDNLEVPSPEWFALDAELSCTYNELSLRR